MRTVELKLSFNIPETLEEYRALGGTNPDELQHLQDMTPEGVLALFKSELGDDKTMRLELLKPVSQASMECSGQPPDYKCLNCGAVLGSKEVFRGHQAQCRAYQPPRKKDHA